MNPDLAKQQDAFRNSLRSQPIISRPVPGDESKEEPRKEIPKAIQETLRFDDSSTIRHINSYVHSILSVLKVVLVNPSYLTLKPFLDFRESDDY